MRALPLRDRRSRLSAMLRAGDERIQFSEPIEGDGPTIFRHVCGLGLEGIVSKRLGEISRGPIVRLA